MNKFTSSLNQCFHFISHLGLISPLPKFLSAICYSELSLKTTTLTTGFWQTRFLYTRLKFTSVDLGNVWEQVRVRMISHWGGFWEKEQCVCKMWWDHSHTGFFSVPLGFRVSKYLDKVLRAVRSGFLCWDKSVRVKVCTCSEVQRSLTPIRVSVTRSHRWWKFD